MAKAEKPPKLTLKAAKAIAVDFLGFSTGIKAHENNNADYQRYEMNIGNCQALITNASGYWGVAYIWFAGKRTYYDIKTLREHRSITDKERRKDRHDDIRDAATSEYAFMFKALVEEHGLESCRNMLEEAGGRL